jgi:hypothetical protein
MGARQEADRQKFEALLSERNEQVGVGGWGVVAVATKERAGCWFE